MRSQSRLILAELAVVAVEASPSNQIVRASWASSLLRPGIAMLAETELLECPNRSTMMSLSMLKSTVVMVLIQKPSALFKDPWVRVGAHTPRSKLRLCATTCKKREE